MAFDNGYSGLENLTAVRAHGWTYQAQLKVNLGRQRCRALYNLDSIRLTPDPGRLEAGGHGA